jgi:hypothetical protein
MTGHTGEDPQTKCLHRCTAVAAILLCCCAIVFVGGSSAAAKPHNGKSMTAAGAPSDKGPSPSSSHAMALDPQVAQTPSTSTRR